MSDPTPSARQLLPTGEARARRLRWRRTKDGASRWVIGAAGIGVVIALATIFIYLFSEVMPLLRDATVELEQTYPAPGVADSDTVHIAADPHLAAPSRFSRSGEVTFFNPTDGSVRARFQLPLPDGVTVTSFATAELRTGLFAYGLSDGSALVGRLKYEITYPDDQRHVEPYIEYPFGEAPVVLDDNLSALAAVAVQEGPTGISLAGVTLDNRLLLARYTTRVSFMTGATEVTRTGYALPRAPGAVQWLLIDITAHNLFAAGRDGRVTYYDISTPDQAQIRETRRLLRDPAAELTALNFLLGGVSLIAGGSDGSVAQWMPVRDPDNLYHLTHIRDFKPHGAAVTAVQPEYSRKGFVTAAANGE
ncbi:MAG: hypothetical protein LC632_09610, partial [Xanthomonadaceae bacterium]|nr:hypothetical protein [Xanthomonadaceae bacterium]